MKRAVLLGVLGFAAAGAAIAAQVQPISYDMPNGSIGTYEYFDDTYTGSGCITCELSPLSGGLGQLTDGIVAQSSWFVVEPPAGPGPYVGWMNVDPTITFHFGTSTAIDSVTFHFDDAGSGTVAAPLSVTIGAANFPVTNPPGLDPFAFTVSGLGFVGTDLTVQIHRADVWSFVSEVTFQSPVPEAGTSAMLLAGLGVMVGLARRRKQRG